VKIASIHPLLYLCRERFSSTLREIEELHLDWDLIYLGRRAILSEIPVKGSSSLVHVNYSYWTIGYLLSARGAKILTEEKPLGKILPVDEYLVEIISPQFVIIS
jgi:collagen beta-1,O-galactosyltransferase